MTRTGLVAACAAAACVLPLRRLRAQDTSALDRQGVRLGIVYRPGVRPGIVVLPGPEGALDSVRAIVGRDLDYSDRFEVITLPGGDSLPLAGTAAMGPGRSRARATVGLNYPLYQALGADFVVELHVAGDTTVALVHDVAAAAVRRTFRVVLPPLTSPGYRLAVHQLSDRIVQTTLGVPGIAATRILFVRDGKVWSIDEDGADLRLVASGTSAALSPAWSKDGRLVAYTEFRGGKGRIVIDDVATGRREPAFGSSFDFLDFTPAFSPDGKTLAFSRASDQGTDIYTVNFRDRCCLQRLTVGQFSDNLSPTYSPDGQRIAFISTRPGSPQLYVMAADGTDQQIFAPFDFGATGPSNAPEWSPDGRTVAFHRDVGGTLQVFVLDARSRTVRQLTATGRNEDPTWAPDSRHLCYSSDRAGYRMLWIIDMETGRIRPLYLESGARLAAWSPELPDAAPGHP